MTRYVASLPDEALLWLEGADAAKFLQGQSTADFSSIATADTKRGCFCDVKGRVLADFLALIVDANPNGQKIALRLHRSLAEPLQSHLKKYLMFSKATLTLMDWHVSGSWGGDEVGSAVIGAQCHQVPVGNSGIEYWCAPDFQAASVTSEASDWQCYRIDCGEARVSQATWGKYLPQDLNYDLTGAVSFQKGCYTGQEIIARLHWRGTPKRRLYSIQCQLPEHASQPAPGSAIATLPDEANSAAKSIGSVVNAASRDGCLYLTVEATADIENQNLTLDGSAMTPISITPWATSDS